MVAHPLLSAAPPKTLGSLALDFLVNYKAFQQDLRFLRTHVRLLQNRRAGRPRLRHRRIVNVEKPVAVAEAVLRQNHVPTLLPKHPDKYAPAFDGHVYAAEAVAEALADAGVRPLNLD